jgi:hypothetical protein
VPDLKLSADGDAIEHAPARPAGPASWWPSPVRDAAGRVGAELAPRSLWRRHRIFTVAVILSLVPRILAILAFRPALLTADSFLYMQGAVHHILGVIRPSGYSLFLALLQFLPNPLLVVTVLQHLMGIAVAVIVYALLRYWGLPGWGATLAALPTLFDTRQIALESYILPDSLFCLVLVIAVALLLTKQTPRRWQCVVAGLLMAYVTVLRGNGLPLAVVVAAFLLIRKVGWRALAAGAAAFAIPVLGYLLVFHAQYGQFNLTNSDGLFLWSRTTSFANCAVIKPPKNLLALCPNRERQYLPTKTVKAVKVPPWSVSYLLTEPTPADYLWPPDAWWRHDAHPGINAYNNRLGLDFALDAIEAQPLDYLKVSARDILLAFLATDRPQSHATMTFTSAPHIAVLPSYYVRDMREYAGTVSNTHPVNPYAYFLFLYQQPVYFPGVVFLAIVLAGLVCVVKAWRRWGGMQALPWALAVVSIVTPALLTQELYRYIMVAIPLSCLAVGLGFARQAAQPGAAAVHAPAAQTPDAQPPDAQPPDAQAPGAQTPAAQGAEVVPQPPEAMSTRSRAVATAQPDVTVSQPRAAADRLRAAAAEQPPPGDD